MKRVYYTWEKWECYRAGFFNVRAPKGLTDDQCLIKYKDLLSDIAEFKRIMYKVINEWPFSTEHNLTNERMNRIAWMGQSALCYKHAIPARFRGGYNLLNEKQKLAADQAALEIINRWMKAKGHKKVNMKSVQSKTEMNIY